MVTPYIIFSGCCSEAVDFYETVFGGKNKKVLRYEGYIPTIQQPLPDNLSNYVLHAEMEICETNFSFADEVTPVTPGNMVNLTLYYKSVEEGKKIYECLIEGGEALLEPTTTFYSPLHARARDKFGIGWNILCI